jgi:choloylglycine hydrolase
MKFKKIYAYIIILIFSVNCLTTSIITACTGITITKDENVIVGHNKDWWSPDTNIHVYPSQNDKYGRLFFEIPYPHIFNNKYKILAGGINEKGLFYESYVTPLNFASFEPFKPPIFKNPVDYIMQYFSTVQEVINYIESHNLFFLNYLLCSGQIFVIDKTGDAAIIEGDEIIRKKGEFQICTNFLHSNPEKGGYPCWRYTTAFSLIENMTDLTVPFFNSILNATHQDGFTQYSSICDLKSDILYLYHFSDYNKPIKLNLSYEFRQKSHSYYLPSLFEPVNNNKPIKPKKPVGPISGMIQEQYSFRTNTSDPDNTPSEIYYKWDFGDGIQTNWILNKDPYNGKIVYNWNKKGTYLIKVKARDIYDKESEWSNPLQITITKN